MIFNKNNLKKVKNEHRTGLINDVPYLSNYNTS